MLKKIIYLWKINNPYTFIKFCRNFGFLFSSKHLFFQNLAIISKYHLKYQHKIILKFLENSFKNNIEQTVEKDDKSFKIQGKIPVWSLWWQGEKDIPETVELCIRSHKKYLVSDKYEYNLLTKDNFSKFIEIPDFIIEKVDKGIISLTHFSEIIRVGLLKKYGGIWIDASIFFVSDLNNTVYKMDFYTNKKFSYPSSMRRHIARGRWISGFMKCNKNNLLCEFLWNIFINYWNKYDTIINYFMIDYLIEVAYQHFPTIKKQIDDVPENNEKFYELMFSANNKMNLSYYKELVKNHSLFFLSRKQKYFEETKNEEKTIYYYLLKTYGLR